ncbi:alkane 1-monooxygenase [Changchengzhania lutea]|uniref:alkane 1-monooxygenase n=1 Tax=Changchengzhania lutea TaxID=2049305 RepID=UPI002938E9AC|nr:alkane 1-monooxygenase [Changchengzhania lutea]
MKINDFKYLAAFSIPVFACLGMIYQGAWSFVTPFYAFVIIPVLELIFPVDNSNLNQSQTEQLKTKTVFDWMLYLNLVVVYGLLIFGLVTVTSTILETYEFIGLIFSMGIIAGVNGINVAHELGHRQTTNERFIGKALLLPALYMHFYIEHNFGHHLHAATKEDPATAKYNQTVYSFWVSSVFRQYFSAWNIQTKLLRNTGNPFFSYTNDMLWYMLIEVLYLLIILMVFGVTGFIFAFFSAIVGFILLETVNYIEHYGLLRLKTPSGRYERVQEIHSWNSNHIIGRIVLYELTRHSDHHFKTTKKYQLLDCHTESPQMPYGYPTSMVLAMIPPLWFSIMNKRIPKDMIS